MNSHTIFQHVFGKMSSARNWIWTSCFIIINSSPNSETKRASELRTLCPFVLNLYFSMQLQHIGWFLHWHLHLNSGVYLINLTIFSSRSNHGSHSWPIHFCSRDKLTFDVIVDSAQVIGQSHIKRGSFLTEHLQWLPLKKVTAAEISLLSMKIIMKVLVFRIWSLF